MNDGGAPRPAAKELDPAGRDDGSDASGTTAAVAKPLMRVRDLGWTREEAAETRARLRPLEDDWNAPGMDAYDDL